MIKQAFRYLLSLLMVLAGSAHFAAPDNFVRIMPEYLPWHLQLVYISGFFEILGGIGLLVPRVQRAAAWGLVALFIAVFPANINMAIHEIPLGDAPAPPLLLWLRLPIQFLLIAWAWWLTKPKRAQFSDHRDLQTEK